MSNDDDKTRQKLVETMRKTKAGKDSNSGESDTEKKSKPGTSAASSGTGEKSTDSKKSTVVSVAGRKTKSTSGSKKADSKKSDSKKTVVDIKKPKSKPADQGGADPYQSPRNRVWPD